MEGWFWRFTDPSSGRVVVALCGVNRHPAGDWATVAVAMHPGQVVRSAVLDLADASRNELLLSAGSPTGDLIEATADRLHVELGDLRLDVEFANSFDWPKRLGGGGLFSALPYLNQYWHPYRLGGTAAGPLPHGGDRGELNRDTVYAERT
ncbi:MAG: tocopherol cyclase family protein, partial [Acidimicrobiales bacterium]